VQHADFNCVLLPDSVDAVSAATLGCRYMSAYRAVVTQGRVAADQWVAVHGAGGMGLAAVQIAKQRGAKILVVDNRDVALAKATEEGADVVLNSADEDDVITKIRESTEGGPRVAIDAIGGQETSVNGIASLGYGGRFVQAGLTTKQIAGNVTIPMDLVVALELEIVGSFGNPRSDYDELMALVGSGELKPGSLVTRRENISQINSIMTALDTFDTVGVAIIDSFDAETA
jgi:propanol-preferring alcohol dehydrogenase